MIKFFAGSSPIRLTQPNNDLYFSIIPSRQTTESNETSIQMDIVQAEFISPYPTPGERIAYVFTGNFKAEIQALLNEPQENGNAQGDNAEAIDHYKNWLALKELMECMDSRVNQAKLLILGIVSTWLGTHIVSPRFSISGTTWAILISLSATVLLYLKVEFGHLAKKKEDAESYITQFEAMYEFVPENRVDVANDRHKAPRLETRIHPRRSAVTPLNSPHYTQLY